MIKRVWDEFKSTPIQSTVAVISLLTMIVGGFSSIPLFESAQTQDPEITKNGVVYALTMSTAITFICATVVKFIPSGIPTFFGSIVIASINFFIVINIFDSSLIDGLHGQQLNSARNVAFYGIMAIYSIFNLNIAIDESTDGGSLIISLIFFAAIWGSMVSKGEGYLTGAFNPSLKEVKISAQKVP